MSVRGAKPSSARRRSAALKGLPLDSAAHEAIERFARVLTRCGFGANAVSEAFGRALTATQGEIPQIPRGALRELTEAPHLVTLWCSSPEYVSEHGIPMPLPVRGSRRSLESLVRRLGRSLDVEEVLRYLIRTRTVRRIGKQYVLNRRWVLLRGISGSVHSRGIRVLVGILRTMEHNLVAEPDAQSWFEFTAENPRFPVSQLEAFDQLLRRTGLGCLRKLDLFMQRCEAERNPGEPTVWLGVGMHHFQLELSALGGSAVPSTPKKSKASPLANVANGVRHE